MAKRRRRSPVADVWYRCAECDADLTMFFQADGEFLGSGCPACLLVELSQASARIDDADKVIQPLVDWRPEASA